MPSLFVISFTTSLVDSETDNDQAVSILIEDDRCTVSIYDFEMCLRNGFTAMAAVLQQDERVKKDVQMCLACSENVGCYECTHLEGCVVSKEARYCRKCVLKDDRYCQSCKDYLCPLCYEAGVFGACEKCGRIECRHDACCEEVLLIQCQSCDRTRCETCMEEDGEELWNTDDKEGVCPTCQNRRNEEE